MDPGAVGLGLGALGHPWGGGQPPVCRDREGTFGWERRAHLCSDLGVYFSIPPFSVAKAKGFPRESFSAKMPCGLPHCLTPALGPRPAGRGHSPSTLSELGFPWERVGGERRGLRRGGGGIRRGTRESSPVPPRPPRVLHRRRYCYDLSMSLLT